MAEKARLKRSKQGLTEEQLQEIREVFDQFDSDGGGSIDVNELRAAMKALGQPLSAPEAEQLMLELDSGGDGSIEFAEFVDFIRPKILSMDLEKEVRHQFAEFADQPKLDLDGNIEKNKFDEEVPGFITRDGLRRVAEDIGEMCTDEELEEIIYYCTDGQDRIDENTFLRICKSMRLF
mmetsp:Transcript_24667/g.38757  ORF Transcript_24667/g.38757 Transcript_24667/m.38757 type:complete len:178 (+) Transcript_24667:208-741(+)